MDLHADQIQGFFDVPVDHLYASAIFIPYIKQLQLENLVMASPDTGGSKRANAYAKYLGTELVISHKFRKRANQIEKMRIIGDVVGKNVILIDDMIDTAGTITKAADMMMDGGALSVRALASHAVLSGPAIERIENSSITELITTDSIPQLHGCTKIRTLSVAELFSNVITNVYSYRSISSNFII
jgi:ribose-phosphate pyrophosphokinase